MFVNKIKNIQKSKVSRRMKRSKDCIFLVLIHPYSHKTIVVLPNKNMTTFPYANEGSSHDHRGYPEVVSDVRKLQKFRNILSRIFGKVVELTVLLNRNYFVKLTS